MARLFQDAIDAAQARAGQLDVERLVGTACAILLVLLLYYVVVSSAWLRLMYACRKPLSDMLLGMAHHQEHDSDAWSSKWNRRDQVSPTPSKSIRSPRSRYRLQVNLGGGDVSDVLLVQSRGRHYVMKRSRGCWGNDLLQHEFRLLEQLPGHRDEALYGDYLPWPVESFQDAGRRVVVYAFRERFVVASAMLRRYPHGLDGRHLAWMFNRMLEVLGYAHQQGWVHGGLVPPHLLFHPENHGLQLLGWTHAQRIGRPLRFAPTRYRDWYPPECHARRPATAATDIYLAARCLLWLACGHGKPSRFPDTVPDPIRTCLQSCLSASPALRPQEAWGLHRDFTQLLEQAYGPPRFCHLDVS